MDVHASPAYARDLAIGERPALVRAAVTLKQDQGRAIGCATPGNVEARDLRRRQHQPRRWLYFRFPLRLRMVKELLVHIQALFAAVSQAMADTPRSSSLVENLNSRLRTDFTLRRHLGNLSGDMQNPLRRVASRRIVTEHLAVAGHVQLSADVPSARAKAHGN